MPRRSADDGDRLGLDQQTGLDQLGHGDDRAGHLAGREQPLAQLAELVEPALDLLRSGVDSPGLSRELIMTGSEPASLCR